MHTTLLKVGKWPLTALTWSFNRKDNIQLEKESLLWPNGGEKRVSQIAELSQPSGSAVACPLCYFFFFYISFVLTLIHLKLRMNFFNLFSTSVSSFVCSKWIKHFSLDFHRKPFRYLISEKWVLQISPSCNLQMANLWQHILDLPVKYHDFRIPFDAPRGSNSASLTPLHKSLPYVYAFLQMTSSPRETLWEPSLRCKNTV